MSNDPFEELDAPIPHIKVKSKKNKNNDPTLANERQKASEALLIEELVNSEDGPIHPGIHIFQEYMIPLNLNFEQIVKAGDFDPEYLEMFLIGKTNDLSINDAFVLSCVFSTSITFWLNYMHAYTMHFVNYNKYDNSPDGYTCLNPPVNQTKHKKKAPKGK